MTHTKEELYEGSIARRILLAPIADMHDIMHNRQLHDRQYFVELYHEALDATIRYPGPFGGGRGGVLGLRVAATKEVPPSRPVSGQKSRGTFP